MMKKNVKSLNTIDSKSFELHDIISFNKPTTLEYLFALLVLPIDYKGKLVPPFPESNCVFLELWIALRRYPVFGDVQCKSCTVIETAKIFDIFREEIDFGHRDLFCINVPHRVTFKPLFKQMSFTYVLRITYL